MLRLLPIFLYLAAASAILAWRFGAGPSREELAERARLAECDFVQFLDVRIGQLSLRLPAIIDVTATTAEGTEFGIESDPAPSALNSGFCPNPGTSPVVVTQSIIAFQAKRQLLAGSGLPDRLSGLLRISVDETGAPVTGADWAQMVTMPDAAGTLITAGLSPEGLRITVDCYAEEAECNLAVQDTGLGIRFSLPRIAHEGVLVPGDTLPASLHHAARQLQQAVLTWRIDW